MARSSSSDSGTSAAGPAPIYVIYGSDHFLRDQAMRKVLGSIVDDPEDPGACVEFDPRSTLAEVFDELQTLPMLAEHRGIVVRDADAFIKDHREFLEKYSREPSPTATLVLVCRSFPRGTRLYRIVSEVGRLENCDPPKGQEVLGWIQQHAARTHGKSIDRPAAARLRRLIGDDMQALNSELLKLATYIDGRSAVTLQDVECLVGLRREERVFGIADAIIGGDPARALALWDQVWATDRAAPLRAIGGLAWAMRRYLEAKHHQEAGAPLGGLARQFWTTEAELNARLSSQRLQAFEGHLLALQQADARVKVGAQDTRAAVENLIVERCAVMAG